MLANRSAQAKQFLQRFLAWNVMQRRFSKNGKFEKKQRRMDIAQEMLTTFNQEPELLKKVIAGDNLWAYGYDTETKAQWSRFATVEEIKDILKKAGAVGDTKKECFRIVSRIGKNARVSVLYLGELLWRGQDSYW